MAQFDLHRTRGNVLVLDVQSDLVDTRESRVVVPLLSDENAPLPIGRLNRRLRFEGRDYVVETQFMSSVTRGSLGKPIGSAAHLRDEITRALNILFHGL